MRRFFLIPLLAVLLWAAGPTHPDFAKEGDRWWSRIQVLASDSMEGRNTGSPGHLAAERYVADQFERAGLTPKGGNGYLQPVKFQTAQIIEDQSSLAYVRDGAVTPLRLGPDATLSTRAGMAEEIEADAVFVGYGLVVPENHFDDLAGQDLKGTIAVYLNGAPAEIPSNLRSHYAFRAQRWKEFQRAGIVGAVTIPNPKSMDIPWERSSLARLNASMDLAAEPGNDRFSDSYGQKFGATLNPAQAEQIFTGTGHTLAELLALLDQGKPLPHFPLKLRFRATQKARLAAVESQNVIGMLPGSDPLLKNEYVVFGAHLDHLGVGAEGHIYNGAMDDGSGIASLIEIATLFKEQNLKPKRSILFVAVTGEEKGMLGSRYFTANPTVPIKNIVGEINMDMYLPLYPLKSLEVIGLSESTLGNEMRAVCEKAGVLVQEEKEPQRNLLIRSDQYSFIQHGIPAMTFKFGWERGSSEETIAKDWLRERYHAPSDDLNQPVNKPAAAQFNHIMMELGLRVANAPTRPQWNQNSFFKRFAKPS